MSDTPRPKVFLSYAWTDAEHDGRVERLATELVKHGVEVVFDRWDLQAGQDVNKFMERSVNDAQVSKVLVILNRKYAERANERAGGVGTETLILSPEVYLNAEQTRCIPLVFERDADRPFLPIYLQSRLYYDFSSEESWLTNWKHLIRHIFGILPKKPALGDIPHHLLEDDEEEEPERIPSKRPPLQTHVASIPSGESYRSLYERLHLAFQWHELDMLHAATLLKPFGFTLGTLASPEKTLEAFNEDVLRFVVDYFQIRRDFLTGRSNSPGVEGGYWYKQPWRICQRILELHNDNILDSVCFITFENSSIHKPKGVRLKETPEDIIILISIKRIIGDHEFHTYECWEGGLWGYEKCRLDAKVILLFCERAVKRNAFIHIIGGTLKGRQFIKLGQRELHPAQLVKEGFIGLGIKWYPTDFVTDVPHLQKDVQEHQKVQQLYDQYRLEELEAKFTSYADLTSPD